MKKKMLNFLGYLVFISLSVLLLPPISAMAEGDGGWTTTASPGYHFLIEEDLYNNKKHLVMTALYPDLAGAEVHWGPASGSVNSTYQLKSMNSSSDMISTWQFNSDTQATVTVESCSTNCLWQSGQMVTLNKFFGDNQDSQAAQRYGGCDCGGGTLVRGRYCDNGDGTVTDLTSCLVWLKDADCFGAKPWADLYTSDDAQTRAGLLGSGSCSLADGSGYGDWRLPTGNELNGLTKGTEPILYSSPTPFSNVAPVWYWSSTTYAPDHILAWIVSTYNGLALTDEKDNPNHVWPVRNGN